MRKRTSKLRQRVMAARARSRDVVLRRRRERRGENPLAAAANRPLRCAGSDEESP
jgi:hypothetical protein